MIYISKPHIEIRGNKAFLVSNLKDEVRQLDTEMWYSVDIEFKDYLCDDYADAFLVMYLALAMRHKQDITIEGKVSKKLYFNIKNTIMPLFNKILDESSIINIYAVPSDDIIYKGSGVGCGCSLGVDSLSSFLKHWGNKDCPKDYTVTHLTLFNSGQLGDYDLEASEKHFLESVEALDAFSKATNLPIVAVNSNLNALYRYSGVSLLQSFVQRTASCALALQKLFSHYVYASSYSIDQFCFSTVDESHMESAFAPLFSTENFDFILSNPMMTRVEKTEFISHSSLTPRFLQVCWAEQTALEVWHNTTFLEGKTKTNCGWCDKCLRTLFTLEVIGTDLNDYSEQFELKKYYENRNAFIKKVFTQYEQNVFYKEMVELVIEKKFPIPSDVMRKYKSKLARKKIALRCKSALKLLVHPKAFVSRLYHLVLRR